MGILDKTRKPIAAPDGLAPLQPWQSPQDRWWEDAPRDASDLGEPAESDQAAPDLPTFPPAPCGSCGSPIYWRDIYGAIHCAECRRIPARRMVRDFWHVLASPVRWSPLDEDYWSQWWDPFAHLDAAAANEVPEEEGF